MHYCLLNVSPKTISNALDQTQLEQSFGIQESFEIDMHSDNRRKKSTLEEVEYARLCQSLSEPDRSGDELANLTAIMRNLQLKK